MGTSFRNRRRQRLVVLPSMFAAMVAVIAFGASRAAAQNVKNYTRATLDQWLSKYADAKPDFKPGETSWGATISSGFVRSFHPDGSNNSTFRNSRWRS